MMESWGGSHEALQDLGCSREMVHSQRFKAFHPLDSYGQRGVSQLCPERVTVFLLPPPRSPSCAEVGPVNDSLPATRAECQTLTLQRWKAYLWQSFSSHLHSCSYCWSRLWNEEVGDAAFCSTQAWFCTVSWAVSVWRRLVLQKETLFEIVLMRIWSISCFFLIRAGRKFLLVVLRPKQVLS